MKVITSIAIFLSAMPSASARVKSVGSSALRGLDITYAVSATDAATTSGTWYIKQGKCIDDGLNTWQELYDTQAKCCATENPPSVPICTGAITGWYINWGAGGTCVQDDGQSGWNTLYESAAECCAAENDTPSCSGTGTWYIKSGKCTDDGLNTWQDLYDTQANCCATENPPSVPICTGAITGWYINWGAGGKCVQDDGQSGWNTLYESAAECCAAENDDPSCLEYDSGTVVAASGLVASN